MKKSFIYYCGTNYITEIQNDVEGKGGIYDLSKAAAAEIAFEIFEKISCDDETAETVENTIQKELCQLIKHIVSGGKKHTVIKRCGRYALISREDILTPYIVACGYAEKTCEWNQGYYYDLLSEAAKKFEEWSGYACAKCPNVNDGCVICKR